jgi:hypothetical protein
MLQSSWGCPVHDPWLLQVAVGNFYLESKEAVPDYLCDAPRKQERHQVQLNGMLSKGNNCYSSACNLCWSGHHYAPDHPHP